MPCYFFFFLLLAPGWHSKPEQLTTCDTFPSQLVRLSAHGYLVQQTCPVALCLLCLSPPLLPQRLRQRSRPSSRQACSQYLRKFLGDWLLPCLRQAMRQALRQTLRQAMHQQRLAQQRVRASPRRLRSTRSLRRIKCFMFCALTNLYCDSIWF